MKLETILHKKFTRRLNYKTIKNWLKHRKIHNNKEKTPYTTCFVHDNPKNSIDPLVVYTEN